MSPRDFAIYISHLKSYPVKLAQAIGLEGAVLWWELYRKHGELVFPQDKNFGYSIGISNYNDILGRLVSLGYADYREGGFAILVFDKLITESTGVIFADATVLPWDNPIFKQLLSDYEGMLRRKGKIFNRQETLEKFEGKTLEESIEALRYSIEQKFITIFFKDGKHTKAVGGSPKGTKRRFESGGHSDSTIKEDRSTTL